MSDEVVWVVVWEIPWEDGGFSSVWTSKEAAERERSRLDHADPIGRQFTVVEVPLDHPEVDA